MSDTYVKISCSEAVIGGRFNEFYTPWADWGIVVASLLEDMESGESIALVFEICKKEDVPDDIERN